MKDKIVCYSIDLVLNDCEEVSAWFHSIIGLQSIQTNLSWPDFFLLQEISTKGSLEVTCTFVKWFFYANNTFALFANHIFYDMCMYVYTHFLANRVLL
jgi:hypothetical protein